MENKKLALVSVDGDRLVASTVWVNALKLSANDDCLSEIKCNRHCFFIIIINKKVLLVKKIVNTF